MHSAASVRAAARSRALRERPSFSARRNSSCDSAHQLNTSFVASFHSAHRSRGTDFTTDPRTQSPGERQIRGLTAEWPATRLTL